MSRDFNGSTDYLENTSLALSFPLTMACWFWFDTGDLPSTLMNMGGNSNLHYHLLTMADDESVSMVSRAGGGGAIASTGAAVWNYDTWNHTCGIVASATDRRVFINGGGKVTNSDSRSPTINQFNIGVRFYNATYNAYNEGRIARTAVWDKALTDQQVANLAARQSPLEIEYANLQAYHEILGDFSPEPDWSGNQYNLTLGGTPAQASHVPLPIFPYKIWMPLGIEAPTPDEKLPDKIKIVRSNQIPIPQLQL